MQGAEKEIIILATTITRPSDFVADPLRLNVALTRARRHLLVLGAVAALQQTSGVFAELISAARRRPMAFHGSGAALMSALASQPAPVDTLDDVVEWQVVDEGKDKEMEALVQQEGWVRDDPGGGGGQLHGKQAPPHHAPTEAEGSGWVDSDEGGSDDVPSFELL